jgi:hypothetical protein
MLYQQVRVVLANILHRSKCQSSRWIRYSPNMLLLHKALLIALFFGYQFSLLLFHNIHKIIIHCSPIFGLIYFDHYVVPLA